MSNIINQLATIKVSNEALEQIDIDKIYRSFGENFKKLDDLKNFRSGHEKKNFIERWWESGRLRDAQLDSAEVQAEFSKAIGQLMLISIMQSKKLYEQQTQLKEQQSKLKTQADGIAEQAVKLEKQNKELAEQSVKLEKLVNEYFALKGLTQDGAQKLIDIANEIKSTKEEMLHEFAERTKDVEVLGINLISQMTSLSVQINDQILLSSEQTMASVAEVKRGISNVLDAYQSKLAGVAEKVENLGVAYSKRLVSIEGDLGGLSTRSIDFADALSEANVNLDAYTKQQQIFQSSFNGFEKGVSRQIKLLGYILAGLTVGVLGSLAGVAHLLKLI